MCIERSGFNRDVLSESFFFKFFLVYVKIDDFMQIDSGCANDFVWQRAGGVLCEKIIGILIQR